MDYRLELVHVPVTDVDAAKDFYTGKAGFNEDVDFSMDDGQRFVQLTPVGSAASIALVTDIAGSPPGSLHDLTLVVADVQAARADLAGQGVDVSEVSELAWGSFVYFEDPDGNRWAVQQMPAAQG
jgi:catechol 2,3-dioxygenase-like lactoylglutathione lyase family enzyme